MYEGIQANIIEFRDIAYFNCGKWRGSNEVKPEEVLVRDLVQAKDVDIRESRKKGLALEHLCDGHINMGRNFFPER